MDNLFTKKRTYLDKDGNELVDMCIPSLFIQEMRTNAFLKLNSSHNGRIDRFVWECVSKDIDNGIDMTLYANHLFNPFAIQEGDILYTPVMEDTLYNEQIEPTLPDGQTVSNKIKNEKPMTYAQKVEYFAKLGMAIG